MYEEGYIWIFPLLTELDQRSMSEENTIVGDDGKFTVLARAENEQGSDNSRVEMVAKGLVPHKMVNISDAINYTANFDQALASIFKKTVRLFVNSTAKKKMIENGVEVEKDVFITAIMLTEVDEALLSSFRELLQKEIAELQEVSGREIFVDRAILYKMSFANPEIIRSFENILKEKNEIDSDLRGTRTLIESSTLIIKASEEEKIPFSEAAVLSQRERGILKQLDPQSIPDIFGGGKK
jgi:hypothetical protein